ncbi:23S rRNA G2069 N7-methylase RlmK/C1962 C5-methylase RlmI [Anaerotaenia torta]|uniref:DUF2680 domain-containing protein n=1 Tax=Anaerotaenia torta TaxID=433293 RepID=UPI003D1BFD4C
MYKTRLFVLAAVVMAAMPGIHPVAAMASQAPEQTEQLPEKNKDRKANRALFEEKMNNAIKKWDTLTIDQKNEVYALVENEMTAQDKILDKLTDLGVMAKEDAVMIKTERMNRLNRIRESGEFPLMRPKGCRKHK